jgi:branched-chain amino acid transport system substrate-binding protein
MVRRIAAGLVAGALLVVVTGCGGADKQASSGGGGGSGGTAAAKQSGPIKIGVVLSESGPLQPFDVPPFQAFKMKVDEVNAAGGIGGRQIELTKRDGKSDPAGSRTAAKALIDGGADLLIVPCDFDLGGGPAGGVAAAAGKVSFTLCGQSPKLGAQGVGPLAYSVATMTYAVGHIMADYAIDQGHKSAYVFTDTSVSYTRETCKGFETEFKSRGGTLVGGDEFNSLKDTSVTAQISHMRGKQFDVVAFCSWPPGGPTALRQMRSAGISQPMVAPDAMGGTYWLKAVPGLSNFAVAEHVSIYGDDPESAVNEFVKKYEQVTGSPPVNAYTPIGYSVAEAVIKGIEKAGTTDGQKLAEALNSFKDEPLLLGPTTFTAEDHIPTTRGLRIVAYTKGKPKFVKVENPQGKVKITPVG